MHKAAVWAAMLAAMMETAVPAAHAQQQVAAPVTDPADPKYLSAQTRKMGGPMPAEQMALVFEHLDLALKVFPDQQRIEGVTTLTLRTKAPINTLILDLFPRYTISEIDIAGTKMHRRLIPIPKDSSASRSPRRSKPAPGSRRALSMPARRRSPSGHPGKAAPRG